MGKPVVIQPHSLKKVNRYVDSTCFPHTHKMTKLENQGLEEAVVRWRPAAGGTYSLGGHHIFGLSDIR